MPNQFAEEMNWFLKYEPVIKDDSEEISTMIGKRTKGNGNRNKVSERLVSTYGVQLSGG
jgi:hypothetical protein